MKVLFALLLGGIAAVQATVEVRIYIFDLAPHMYVVYALVPHIYLVYALFPLIY